MKQHIVYTIFLNKNAGKPNRYDIIESHKFKSKGKLTLIGSELPYFDCHRNYEKKKSCKRKKFFMTQDVTIND